MKVKELKAMNDLDLENKAMELRKELMKINSQVAVGTVPKSPGKLRQIKKTIAKILTIKREKFLNKNSIQKIPQRKSKQKGGSKKE